MASGSLYYVFSSVQGLKRVFSIFVIAGVSKGIGNMHEGKWIWAVINGEIRMILCFHTWVYTPVFTVSFKSDDIQRTKLGAIHTTICHSAPYSVPCNNWDSPQSTSPLRLIIGEISSDTPEPFFFFSFTKQLNILEKIAQDTQSEVSSLTVRSHGSMQYHRLQQEPEWKGHLLSIVG